jgi:hypothetical protein
MVSLAAVKISVALTSSWLCYGGGPQHIAQFTGNSQTLTKVHWHATMDDDPGYYQGVVFAHYASPMVSAANTVVYSRRHTEGLGTSNPDYNNFNLVAVNGTTGAPVFSFGTDYTAPLIFTTSTYDWTTMLPTTLAVLTQPSGGSTTGAVVAGAGGSIFLRESVDKPASTTSRLVFYTTLADFNKNLSLYGTSVQICSGITADSSGNVYFGYQASGTPAATFKLGTGGIAKVNLMTGASTFISIASLGTNFQSAIMPAYNGAPALSNDGTALYIGLTDGQSTGYLVKLATSNLKLMAKATLWDPSIHAAQAPLIAESSAAPMVGPDGHVFVGVFGNQWRESHGWLLQFDSNLSQVASNGKAYPVGAFGWDDTPSVVPASIVPSYKGSARYLVLCKYNNYDDQPSDPGADGSNRVAILDPTSNSTTRDRQSGIPVMNEVISVLGPTKTNDDSSHPNAVREWCINSAAVDINKKGAIINSEDGHCYRWSFVTNTLTEGINLQPATSEAYTSTAIGPDGQIYAMNNTLLFAIGN